MRGSDHQPRQQEDTVAIDLTTIRARAQGDTPHAYAAKDRLELLTLVDDLVLAMQRAVARAESPMETWEIIMQALERHSLEPQTP